MESIMLKTVSLEDYRFPEHIHNLKEMYFRVLPEIRTISIRERSLNAGQ